MIFIDLDNFKAVNDTYGHEAGDTVLVAVGQRLARESRESDITVRVGGDEFVVLVLDAGAQEVASAARRYLASIAEPVFVSGHTVRVAASAGTVVATHGAEATAIVKDADSAMYRAKRAGGGRVSD